MDTPEFLPAPPRSDCDRTSGAGGTRFDEVAALFPGMELFHDLRVSGPEAWRLLAAVTAELAARGARLSSLSARDCDGGQVCISCRLSGLSPAQADGLTAALNRLDAVTSARVEHVLLRARNNPAASQPARSAVQASHGGNITDRKTRRL